jgi:mitochondrial chaperone BCS1
MLHRTVSSLPKHSIFLLEDIDCAFPSRDEEQEQAMNHGYGGPAKFSAGLGPPGMKVTMSGLLNVLDGVGSEDGKLFFATVCL